MTEAAEAAETAVTRLDWMMPEVVHFSCGVGAPNPIWFAVFKPAFPAWVLFFWSYYTNLLWLTVLTSGFVCLWERWTDSLWVGLCWLFLDSMF